MALPCQAGAWKDARGSTKRERERMKLGWIAGLGLTALAAGGGTYAFAQANLQQVVTERRDGLKQMGAHMVAMAAIARSGSDPRPAVARIEEMERFYATFNSRFPEGTAMGSPGIDSKAQPAIWQNRADFDRLPGNLLARLATLKQAAAAGDTAAFAPALQATGAACGECHRPYRSR
jgi:cytochrome c556